MKPSMLARAWREYRNKSLNRELLIAYGWGDGGGGPTREMVEAAGDLATPLSRELPTATTGTVRAFMDRLAERLRDRTDVPRWVGEMYFEYHRGTYTSQSRTKRNNRLAERDLHNAELLASLALAVAGQPYPKAQFDEAWQIVLTHQFHDILPGSSIGPVYADAERNYAHARALTDAIIAQSHSAIAQTSAVAPATLMICNSLPWSRAELITIPVDAAANLNTITQVAADQQALALVQQVAPLGYQPASAATLPGADMTITPDAIDTPYWSIALNARGEFTRLYDKRADREVMREGDRGNAFQLFEDKPLNFDAWDIDSFYAQKQWALPDPPEITVVETGPLRGAVRLEWRYHADTRITQFLRVFAHTPRIDFVTTVDWHERQTLLKVAFPADIHNGRATADIQFGNIERPTHTNTSWDQARFETCAHKWVDLAEGDYGVALLNDCKYGYDIHERTLRQTLLKSAISPDRDADQGLHQFTYSLWPHQGDWFTGGVHRAAYDLNYPLLTFTSSGEPGTTPAQLSLVTCDQANVIIETIKRAEDSDALVIRLYECANRRGPLTLRLGLPAARVWDTNLLEEQRQPASLAGDGLTITGAIAPYQIKTFVVELR
jgi:alpha-mannosidase